MNGGGYEGVCELVCVVMEQATSVHAIDAIDVMGLEMPPKQRQIFTD